MSVVCTPQQRELALAQANGVRTGRRALRLEVLGLDRKRGAIRLADLLLDSPACLASAYVWRVVGWVHGIGDEAAGRLLRAAGVDPWRKVGRLTERQRKALVQMLRCYAYGRPLVPPAPVNDVPRRREGPVCELCGEHLRQRSESGLCGFCEAER